MSDRALQVFPLVFLCGVCAGLGSRGAREPGTGDTPAGAPRGRHTVTIGREIFHLELAVTDKEIERGLMQRRHVAPDGGMLFIFPDAKKRTFWMAYTLVDLDIAFLDAKQRVTAVHEMPAERPRADGESERDYFERLRRYDSNAPARYAIEFKAGTLGLLKLAVGTPVPLGLPASRGGP